jgi:hypothetical protein
VGAFLLAGSEVYRLVTPPAAPALSIPRPDHAKRHRK